MLTSLSLFLHLPFSLHQLTYTLLSSRSSLEKDFLQAFPSHSLLLNHHLAFLDIFWASVCFSCKHVSSIKACYRRAQTFKHLKLQTYSDLRSNFIFTQYLASMKYFDLSLFLANQGR
jgi:hypothetical protein